MLPLLRDDALVSTPDGVAVRVCLPWIRSLPVWSLTDLAITIDGEPLEVAAPSGTDAEDWWFVQDRLTVEGRRMLSPGAHDVSVSFGLVIPYLPASPSAPLMLPFRSDAALTLDAPHVSRPIGERAPRPRVVERSPRPPVADRAPQGRDELPPGWTLAASAFNWTPDVIAADRPAPDIAVGIVADGVADVIEVELGQLWRSFPEPEDGDADALRDALAAAGGSVSIVGASIDDWSSPDRRRDDDERLAFLIPQLRAAHRLGAKGARLPIGQAGTPLLRRLLPTLHELDLVLYEEVQGQQSPGSAVQPACDAIADLDDRHVRLLVDISMLMPALPTTYLAQLRDGGVPSSLVDLLESDWRDPATHQAVVALLQSGGVPPRVHTLYMNLLIRFGRSDATDLRSILPVTGGFHLKFWDLDDADGRVSRPMRELGAEIARAGFEGTLCSEWGGHEWLEGLDATETTRSHLQLARTALAHGAESATNPKENSWLTPSAI